MLSLQPRPTINKCGKTHAALKLKKKSTKSLDAIERIWSEWAETEAANTQDWTKFNQATSGETQPKQMEENDIRKIK